MVNWIITVKSFNLGIQRILFIAHGWMVLSRSVMSDSVTFGTVAHQAPLSVGFVFFFFQARILEWVAISSSRISSQPKDRTHNSCVSSIAGGLFTHWAIEAAPKMHAWRNSQDTTRGAKFYWKQLKHQLEEMSKWKQEQTTTKNPWVQTNKI